MAPAVDGDDDDDVDEVEEGLCSVATSAVPEKRGATVDCKTMVVTRNGT